MITRIALSATLVGSLAATCFAAAAPTPQQLVDQMAARFAKVNDYEVQVDSTTNCSGKPEAVRYRFAYKKPGMVRLHTLSGENKDGELAVSRAGKIRGRKNSGLIKVFAISMTKTDKRLLDAEGVGVWEMDFGSLISRLQAKAKSSAYKLAVAGPDAGGDYVLEVKHSGGPIAGATDKYWVDGQSYSITKHERYRGSSLSDRNLYSQMRVNVGFTDNYFEF